MKVYRNNSKSMFSVVVLVVAVVIMSLTLASIVAAQDTVTVANADTTADVFASYQGLMPGQMLAELDGISRLQSPPVPGWHSSEVYALFPQNSAFHAITFEANQGAISSVNFFSDSLQLGDLIAQWDEPDSSRRAANGQTITLGWDEGDYHISAVAYLLGQQPHVRLVSLTAN
jgi:hypothetical protein